MSKKPFAWDETTTAEVIAVYLATLEDLHKENEGTDAVNSRQALAAAAEAVGTSEASARIKLAKEGKYVKVETKKPEAKASTGATGGKRMNKADQQAELVAAFADHGVSNLDMEIIDKLTGKAAAHLAAQIRLISTGE